jgi:predicted type IV restriction endonuclease
MQNKLEQIKQARPKLRADLIEKMRTNPTMKDSETLRLVENDISFWEQQTDHSVGGLIATLNASLKR